MAGDDNLKKRVKDFFLITGAPEGVTAFSDDDDTPEFARVAQKPFSPFDSVDSMKSANLMSQMKAIFMEESDPDEGVARVMEKLEEVSRNGELALAQHALSIFSVHLSKFKAGSPSLPVPPLAFRAPEGAIIHSDDDEEDDDDSPSPASAGEDLMHWFREDLYLNEHHRHWHIVYPTPGVDGVTKKRQGEIFLYMHKQMLARYNTERITSGLGKTEAFTDFSDDFSDSYDPTARFPKLNEYGKRPSSTPPAAKSQLNNILMGLITNTQSFLDSGGQIDVVTDADPSTNPSTVVASETRQIDLTADSYGVVIESNLSFSSPYNPASRREEAAAYLTMQPYQLHNTGHGLISYLTSSTNGQGREGVMANPHVACMDPIFWRWHTLIDNTAETFYASLTPYDTQSELFSGSGILIADSGSVALFSQSNTVEIPFESDDLNARMTAVQTHARQVFQNNESGESELKTGLIEENFIYRYHGSPQEAFKRESLVCERFSISLKLQSQTARAAVARIFICADEFLDLEETAPTPARRAKRAVEHRHWIELDRQPVELVEGENIFSFMSDESSIVRKLRGRALWPTSSFTEAGFDEMHIGSGDHDDFCDCGWPHSLHLPKGTSQGMSFKMMALVSPGSPVVAQGNCGSRSFCGTKDGYPELDTLNMGFPFDRPAKDGTLNFIRESTNMAVRSFTIRHVPDLLEQLNQGVG